MTHYWKGIISSFSSAKIDFSSHWWSENELVEVREVTKQLLSISKCTLLETTFRTLIDVLKNLNVRRSNSHTVSRQKQESVLGQSIETSLPGDMASNLLGCIYEGHTFYNSQCSQWCIRHAPAKAKRHVHTALIFNTLTVSHKLSRCLSAYQAHMVLILTRCFSLTSPDELLHTCARIHLQHLTRTEREQTVEKTCVWEMLG